VLTLNQVLWLQVFDFLQDHLFTLPLGALSRPRLKGLRGGQTSRALPPLAERKKKQNQDTQKMDETRVPSDTYPLQGKTNRACEEISWTLVSADAAEG
jgi:hypothetical protein